MLAGGLRRDLLATLAHLARAERTASAADRQLAETLGNGRSGSSSRAAYLVSAVSGCAMSDAAAIERAFSEENFLMELPRRG